MPGEAIYPTANSTATDTAKHRQLDHDIRDMIAALTKRLAELQHIHKSSTTSNQAHVDSSHNHPLNHNNPDHHGQQIITLAGTNQGATMHGELMDEKSATPGEDADDDAYDTLGTYVNSNFQAVNNSIMTGGSYTTNDPGVHMDVSDVFDQHYHQHGHHDHHHHHAQKHDHAYEKKGTEMDKANGKSHLHHSESSD